MANPLEDEGALGASADWGPAAWCMGLLAAFAVVCAWVGAGAFRTDQRSV